MKQLTFFLFCILTISTYGQKNTGPKFDIADFNSKFEVVKWLFEYDYVAWHTSDSVMIQDKNEINRLGSEWFCFRDKSDNWHAVYGKYANEAFDLVFHFKLDDSFKISRVYEKVDTSLLNSYSRALITANKQIKQLKDTVNISFNQFIKQNDDKTFSVYIFPAYQRNHMVIYGGEFIYSIDYSGRKILKDESYFQGNFRGFKDSPSREIWLNYRELEKPTLGAIFFVWYYKQYFTSINIDCSKSVSTVIKDDNNDYTWLHIEKDPEKTKKN